MIIMSVFYFIPLNKVSAGEPLVISNININQTDKTATISWRTNRAAYGTVKYGLYTDDYYWRLNTNKKVTEQAITISGLFPDTTYFIRIVADDESSEVTSFEQNFKTKKATDNKSPEISDVQVVYTTGGTATIQWYTDEKATSEVQYGMTEKYGQTAKDERLTKIHDITIKGLKDGTQYHFLVKSKDKDKNVSKWYDLTFRTKLTKATDKDDLIIYSIKPESNNNLNVTENTAVISWRTNKLARGWVRYGTSLSYGKTVYTNPPRDFTHSVTLTGLKPGQIYYFEIGAYDVFGKETKSSGHSFTTKTGETSQEDQDQTVATTGKVLGVSNLDIDFSNQSGFYGMYYNLTPSHPDVDIPKSKRKSLTKIASENDWYSDQYFSFERVDKDLNFGKSFLPVNDNKKGDPYDFAVYWRAVIYAPEDDYYEYQISSDDDSSVSYTHLRAHET